MAVSASASSGAGAADDAATANPAPIPLSSATTVSSGATAIVQMGIADDASNTFWELLVRRPRSLTWQLRTPPGVADNGGLVATPPQGPSIAVGFLPSADLTFSPLATTADNGAHWSSGTVARPLLAAPDALGSVGAASLVALTAGAGGGADLAIEQRGKPDWQRLGSAAAIRPFLASCADLSFTAVAAAPDRRVLIGLACVGTDRVGVGVAGSASERKPSGWREIGFDVPGLGRGTTSVLRLESIGSGTVGLARLSGTTTTSLVAFWQTDAIGSWTRTAPLTVPRGWTVRATATGGGGGRGVAVLLGAEGRRRIEETAGPASPWRMIAGVPPGTGTIATVGDETDAFVANRSQLVIWRTGVTDRSWKIGATMTVPLQYGSSS